MLEEIEFNLSDFALFLSVMKTKLSVGIEQEIV